MDQSSKHSPRAEPALDVELEPQELSEELGEEAVMIDIDRRDADPDVDLVFAPDVMERSDLAIVLRPDAFPAEPGVLIAVAEEEDAPPEVLARLAQLPAGEYHTVGEVWEALGGPTEHRGVGAPEPEEPEEPEEAMSTADERLVEEMEEELDELDEQVEEALQELPEALGETLAQAAPRSQEPPPSSPPRREREVRPSPLQPVATLTALPLRITARILRAQADILERLADAVPGASRRR